MLTTGLYEHALIEPFRHGADKLCAVSGYASPNMASLHLMNLGDEKLRRPEVSLLVGMCVRDGIDESIHKGFSDIMAKSDGDYAFECSYVYKGLPVHAKVYVWLQDGNPVVAYAGSANYSQPGFLNGYREILVECDPAVAWEFRQSIVPDTIYCTNDDVGDHVKITSGVPSKAIWTRHERTAATPAASYEHVVLSLLSSRDGEVPQKSGLNWGHRGSRNRNEAYIQVAAGIVRSNFFPRGKRHFTLITDDDKALIVRLEQDNDKAMTTPRSNADLGEYIRYRLGLANGAPVTRADLERYGRTDVDFYKIDEEHFLMDFSPPR